MPALSPDQYRHFAQVTASPPTGGDDSTQGYELGQEWLDTSTEKVWKLVAEPSPGNAVWKDTTATASGAHPVTQEIRDPEVTDDVNAGFSVGDHWVNTTTDTTYQAVDVTAGAAVWKQTSNTQGAGKQTPKEHFLDGNLLDFGATGAASGASVIQYSRVWLTAGVTISDMRVFVDSGGNNNRYMRLGLYVQADPTDINGIPTTKVRETLEVPTTPNGSFITTPLGSPYVVAVTGYYWLAFVVDSTRVKFSITNTVYRQDFLPVRRESTTGTILPATAGGLTNPSAVLVYVAGVEP